VMHGTATSVPICSGALGQWRFTQGMLNIFHARIAFAARCQVSSPLPSWMRLWSTLYPVGAAVADAPTSGYEKPESFCPEMKRRILSSEGSVRLNKRLVTLLRRCGLRRRLEAGRHLSGQTPSLCYLTSSPLNRDRSRVTPKPAADAAKAKTEDGPQGCVFEGFAMPATY
jgi:hypothetical protein